MLHFLLRYEGALPFLFCSIKWIWLVLAEGTEFTVFIFTFEKSIFKKREAIIICFSCLIWA